MPCVKKKADRVLKWIYDHCSMFGERLVAFAAVQMKQRKTCFVLDSRAQYVFLWFICVNLLAQEVWPHARSCVLQQAYQSR